MASCDLFFLAKLAAITFPNKEVLLISDRSHLMSGYNDALTPLEANFSILSKSLFIE